MNQYSVALEDNHDKVVVALGRPPVQRVEHLSLGLLEIACVKPQPD